MARLTLLCSGLMTAAGWLPAALPHLRAPAVANGNGLRHAVAPRMSTDGLSKEFAVRCHPAAI
jgi:hypothetical protein